MWTNTDDDVPISAFKVALNDESKLWSREVAEAAGDEADINQEILLGKSQCEEIEGFMARAEKSAGN